MITAEQYNPTLQAEWNQINRSSPNGLFLFDRDYMDYHADRFTDHSLVFMDDGKPIALLPANIDEENQLVSHGGLTFGSLIRTPKLRSRDVLEVFGCLLDYAAHQSFSGLLYKAIPPAFQSRPSDDDLYALNRSGFRLVRRDLSSIVPLDQPVKYSKGRKWSIGKAAKSGITIHTEHQLDPFYDMLEHRLDSKYATKPTHTRQELALLASRFPQNIRISCAFLEGSAEPCAGVTLYDYGSILHTQYMATTDDGRDIGALDYLIDHHINEARQQGRHSFSFGISTEEQGTVLNAGLVQQKESFGARGAVHDFYKLER